MLAFELFAFPFARPFHPAAVLVVTVGIVAVVGVIAVQCHHSCLVVPLLRQASCFPADSWYAAEVAVVAAVGGVVVVAVSGVALPEPSAKVTAAYLELIVAFFEISVAAALV